MVVAGACFVVLGGLVAAVARPLDFEDGSWLAAYLVLVCGVAQYAMGRFRQLQLPAGSRSESRGWAQFAGWNLGNAGVIAGTLAGTALLVDAGSVLLVIALLIAFRASWEAVAGRTEMAPPLVLWTYRLLLLILIVSIPVGILMSHLRN